MWVSEDCYLVFGFRNKNLLTSKLCFAEAAYVLLKRDQVVSSLKYIEIYFFNN